MLGHQEGGEIAAYVTAPHNVPVSPSRSSQSRRWPWTPMELPSEWLASRAPCSHRKGLLRSPGALFHSSTVSKPLIMSMNFKQSAKSFTTSPNLRPQ